MQADLSDDSLVRETMASLGPGAKDSTLDDLATWIRQLEELCGSPDAALAPASFRTDINGSCLSTFPVSGGKLSTTAQSIKMQTKAVKGYPPLLELHMEKVSSKKKNARGEEKLRLSVERGPILVLLTITDLEGANRTLRVVTDLIPIKHPATTIEATVVPFAPDQLLERLRRVEEKIKPQREQQVQPSASPQQSVEEASAQRQADGVKYMTKRIGGQVIEQAFDPETGTLTVKMSGCSNPYCDGSNCTMAPATITLNFWTGETDCTSDSPQVKDVLAQMLKSYEKDPRRQIDLCKRVASVVEEVRSIKEKLSTAKTGEKKRLSKELESKNAEYAKLNDLMFRTAETGGWFGVPMEKIAVLMKKAMHQDPKCFEALYYRAIAACAECALITKKLESASSQTKKKRLCSLLGRKKIEFDAVMNDIAVIADASEQQDTKEPNDSSEQDDSKELNDISIHMNEALVLEQPSP